MAIALGDFGDGIPGNPAAVRGGVDGHTHLRSATGPLPAPVRDPAAAGTAPAAGGRAESSPHALVPETAGRTAGQAGLPGSRLLKKSFALIEPQSEKFMAYFYGSLFARHPELRPMFPLAMDSVRERLCDVLARYVWSSDHPGALAGCLTELGRDHRKYGVTQAHLEAFCDSLLPAIGVFAGRAWTPETSAAWKHALGDIAAVMTGGIQSTPDEPGWWVAEVTGHQQLGPDLAILTLQPDTATPLPFRPGQHVSVQVPHWPRVWREYSVANAPRRDGQLSLHVRAVPGGMVSNVLVRQTAAGDTLVLGRARGSMTADAASSDAIVCIAGGTGLAPVKAIVESLTRPERLPPAPGIQVFFGARTEAGLYGLAALRRLAKACPSVAVIPVVSHDPGFAGLQGLLPEVAAGALPPGTGDVFISGPPAMVSRTAQAVAAYVPSARIHLDPPWPARPAAASAHEPAAPGTGEPETGEATARQAAAGHGTGEDGGGPSGPAPLSQP